MDQLSAKVGAVFAKYGEFNEAFQRESDRGCAVLVMCAVEEALREVLRHRIGEAGKGMMGQLAPPGAWERLIKSLRLVGVMSDMEAHDLDLLRQARNLFAHGATADLTFEHGDVRAYIDRLKMHKAMWISNASPRDAFTMSANAIMAIVVSRGLQADPMVVCPDIAFGQPVGGPIDFG